MQEKINSIQQTIASIKDNIHVLRMVLLLDASTILFVLASVEPRWVAGMLVGILAVVGIYLLWMKSKYQKAKIALLEFSKEADENG